MANVKEKSDKPSSIIFPRTGNPWLDAGIVGLYRVLMARPSYVKSLPSKLDALPGSIEFPQVQARLEQDGLIVTGPTAQVQGCLEKAYDLLIDCYFNISSKKQFEDKQSYNFFLDSATETFKTFPKKRSAGAALLLFDKAARPVGSQVKWGLESGKKCVGKLPEELTHLQDKLNQFLKEHHLKASPPGGLLVDGENEVRPKIKINVKAKPGTAPCFLKGDLQPGLSEAKNTAFPLFGGSRSFVSGTTEKLRIGWQLDFVGKFVPAIAFFYQQDDDMHVFFPFSRDLRRIDEISNILQSMKDLDPNFYRNFKLESLGGYFARSAEVIFAFLYHVLANLSKGQTTDSETSISSSGEQNIISWDDLDEDEEETEVVEPEISSETVYNETVRQGEVGFTVVSARKKGNVWMAHEFWIFDDLVYLARLFERMQERQIMGESQRVRQACSPRGFMNVLIDFDAKNDKTVLRNRVCGAVLNKQSVLSMLERHAYHLYSQSSKSRNLSQLLDFALLYEVARREENSLMTKEDYERMVSTARWLGQNIADAAVDAADRKQDSAGRSRGVFFRLRKTRSTQDFLDELARLQLRYPSLNVPKDGLDPVLFNHETFEEFRGFCVVAALSRFQWKTKPKDQPTKPNENKEN